MGNWNKIQVSEGKCRVCGKKREQDRINKTRCLSCSIKESEYARRTRPGRRSLILAYQKKRYKENTEKCLAVSKAWRENARLKVYDRYGGRKCSCCGETRLAFLTLDHINNDGHKYRKKGMDRSGGSTYLWAMRNNYPPSLRVLCYNCNSGRHRNGGICPHKEE